jgi:hypothetical protein
MSITKRRYHARHDRDGKPSRRPTPHDGQDLHMHSDRDKQPGKQSAISTVTASQDLETNDANEPLSTSPFTVPVRLHRRATTYERRGAGDERRAHGLVIYRLDRLARDLVLQEQLLAEVRKLGCVVLPASEAESAFLVDHPDDP